MTAKIKLTLIISALAVFAVFLSITVFSAGPTCGTGGVCSVLTTDGSGNFGIGANAIAGSKLYVETGGTGATDYGLRVVDSSSVDVLTIAGDGKVKIYKATGLEFSDGTIQTTAATGGGVTSTSAGYITPGYFNSVAGTGGNYSFPASLSVGTSTAPSGGVFLTVGNMKTSGTITASNGFSIENSNYVFGSGAYNFFKPYMSSPAASSELSTAKSLYLNIDADGNETGTSLIFGHNANGSSATALMSILDSGNVGIGTVNPQFPLDISGTSNKLGLTYSYTAEYGATGAELSADSVGDLHIIATKRFPSVSTRNILLAENGGKVGIATTTPAYPLTVSGVINSSTGGFRFPDGTTQTTAATGGGGGSITTSSAVTAGYFPYWATGSSITGTSSIFQSGGNIGIGTATVNAKLHINGGDVYIFNNNANPRFLIGDSTSGGTWGGFTWNSAGDYVSIGTDTGGMTTLNILETGNVGIGTTAPAYPLDVVGGTFATGTIRTSQGIRFGTNGLSAAPVLFAYDAAGYTTPNPAGKGLGLYSYSATAGDIGIGFSGNNVSITSGDYINATFARSFVPTSGTGTFSIFKLLGSINQTGGANGITRGLYISPTLTAAADWRSIDIGNNSGFGIYQSGASAKNYFAGNVGVGTTAPLARLHSSPAGASANVPAAGTIDTSTSLYLTNANVGYGLLSGVLTNGNAWLQAQRTDTTATTYKLLLNPNGGSVGIATTTPTYPLTVEGVINSSTGGFRFPDGTTQTTASTGGISLSGANTWTNADYFQVAAGSGVYLKDAGGGVLQAFSSDGGSAHMSFHRSGAYAVNVGLDPDGSFAIGGWSNGAVNRIKIETTGNTTFGSTGTAKINVGTIDPPYTINGEQYATYLPGMIGQKEETTGELKIECRISNVKCEYIIDFTKAEKGSDLWLFAKTTNLKNSFDKMTVLLTPSFDGKVWYEKDTKNNTLKIFGAPSEALAKEGRSDYSVSYRLTAPRFDSEKWTNTRNDADVTGFIIND